MSVSRPALWPLHDIYGTNLITPETSLYLFSGYPVGLPVPSADHNGKLQRGGQWHQYLDQDGLRNEDWLDISTSTVVALTSTSLRYANGGNVLTTGGIVSTRATYLFEGTRIETDYTLLTPVGSAQQGDPLKYPLATAPGRIWIYVSNEGVARFDSVAPSTADAPAANEMTLVGVDIDAIGAITDGAVVPTTVPLPTSRSLPITIPVDITEAVTITGTGTMLAVTGTLFVDGETNVVEGRIIHRSHATAATWTDNALHYSASAFGEGTVPGGGGTVAVKQITATASPTSEQVLAPDPCMIDIDLRVFHYDTVTGERRNDHIVAQYTVSAGTMTSTASNVLLNTQEAPLDMSATVLPSGAVLQVTFAGLVGAAGNTTRYGYYINAVVMPL